MATVERHLATLGTARERTGGRFPRPSRFERHENIRTSAIYGSHMPIDTDLHWSWRNPLNILPATVLLLFVVAIVGTALTLL